MFKNVGTNKHKTETNREHNLGLVVPKIRRIILGREGFIFGHNIYYLPPKNFKESFKKSKSSVVDHPDKREMKD